MATVPGEGGERLLGEVGADECADVNPVGVPGGLDRLLGAPRIAHAVLRDDPLVALVVEAVGGRRARVVPGDRQTEALQVLAERRTVFGSTRRGHVRVGAEVREGSGGVENPAAGPGRRARDDVAGDMADGRDDAHAGAAPAAERRESTATTAASVKAARKLGIVAPMLQAGGSSFETRSTHQLGPVG